MSPSFSGIFLLPPDYPGDSDVMEQVLDDMPPDPTNIEDSLHVALLSGNLKEVLQHAHKLDPWLAAHLADLMVPLQLIDSGIDDE